MKKIVLALLLTCAILSGTVQAKTARVTFEGKDLSDQNIGIIITQRDHKYFAVTCPRFHYAFILPYKENWTFEINDQNILFGQNGKLNLSIDFYPPDNQTDEKFLTGIKENLEKQSESLGLEKAEFSSTNGIAVLTTLLDLGKATQTTEFKNIKQQNLFITKTNSEARGVLHFSMIMAETDPADWELYVKSLCQSFTMDFMLKQAK